MRSVLYPVLLVLDLVRVCSFGFYLVFLSFTFLRPLDIFAPNLLAARPMMWLLIFALISGVLDAAKRGQLAARPLQFKLLSALMLVIVASMFVNGGFDGVQLAIGEFFSAAVIFVLSALNLNSLERIRITCLILLFSMAAAALISIYSYHTGFEWHQLVVQQKAFDYTPDPDPDAEGVVPAQDTSGMWLWRIRGVAILNDPNDFAQMLVLVFPFIRIRLRRRSWGYAGTALHALGKFFQGIIDRMSVAYELFYVAPIAAALLYGIYLTHSRGALLGLASLLFFALQRRLGTVRTGLLIALGGLAVSFLNFNGGREVSVHESSAGERIDAWRLALELVRSHPLLGVGYNNFTEYNELTAHNSFALCFAELGLLGYFTWIAMIVVAYVGIKRVLDETPNDSGHHQLASLLRSALIGYLTCAWFLSRSYSAGLYLILGLCSAMAYAVAYDARRDARAEATPVVLKPVHWLAPTFKTMLATMILVQVFVLFAGNSGGS